MTTVDVTKLEDAEQRELVAVDVWGRLVDEHGKPTGFIKRKRYKTFAEIYKEMHGALEKIQCSGCGKVRDWTFRWWEKRQPKWKPCCGGSEYFEWIDEYDSMPYDENRPIAALGEEVVGLQCWCEEGGNEGDLAKFGVLLQEGRGDVRFVQVYWIKSFRGIEHCHMLVEQMMRALGIGRWEVK